jgi:hypothetical protein
MNTKKIQLSLISSIMLLSFATSYASTIIVKDNGKCVDHAGHVYSPTDLGISINGEAVKSYHLVNGVAQDIPPTTLKKIAPKYLAVMSGGGGGAAGFVPDARNISTTGTGPANTVTLTITDCSVGMIDNYFDGVVNYQNK